MVHKKISGLNRTSQKKKQDALEKTEKAIAILVKKRQKITIRSVAREAGVSVSYIYKYPELAYKIQRLREQQRYSLIAKDSKHLQQDETEKLLSENIKLKLEVEELRGRAF